MAKFIRDPDKKTDCPLCGRKVDDLQTADGVQFVALHFKTKGRGFCAGGGEDFVDEIEQMMKTKRF